MAKKKRKKTKKNIKKLSFKTTKKYFLAVFLILILIVFLLIVNKMAKNQQRKFICVKLGTEMKCSWKECTGGDNILVLKNEQGDNKFQVINEETGSFTFSDLSGTYTPLLICGDNIEMLPAITY